MNGDNKSSKEGEDMNPGLRYERTFVTPEMAKRLLESQPRNRNLKPYVYMQYARDMRAGRWRENGIPVVLDADGQIIDGQHRMAAVVESGCGQWMVLCIGVPREYRSTMDRNSRRNGADVLRMDCGAPNGKAAASLIGMVTELLLGTASSGLTDGELRTAYDHHHDEINWTCDQFPKFPKDMRSSPFLAPLVFLRAFSPFVAEAFVEQVSTGANLSDGHPVLALRKRFIGYPINQGKDRLVASICVLQVIDDLLSGKTRNLTRFGIRKSKDAKDAARIARARSRARAELVKRYVPLFADWPVVCDMGQSALFEAADAAAEIGGDDNGEPHDLHGLNGAAQAAR